MAFPRIIIKTTNFERNALVEDMVEKRLSTLERLLPLGETAVTCDVELERLAGQQTGRIFRAEINLSIGGKFMRAEATESRMEDAIDHAKNELKSELSRAAGKRESMWRRGARRIKDMMRFGGE